MICLFIIDSINEIIQAIFVFKKSSLMILKDPENFFKKSLKFHRQ